MNELTVHFQARSRPIDEEFLARIGAVAEEYDVAIDPFLHSESKTNRILNSHLKEFIRKADELVERMQPQSIDCADLIRDDRENF